MTRNEAPMVLARDVKDGKLLWQLPVGEKLGEGVELRTVGKALYRVDVQAYRLKSITAVDPMTGKALGASVDPEIKFDMSQFELHPPWVVGRVFSSENFAVLDLANGKKVSEFKVSGETRAAFSVENARMWVPSGSETFIYQLPGGALERKLLNEKVVAVLSKSVVTIDHGDSMGRDPSSWSRLWANPATAILVVRERDSVLLNVVLNGGLTLRDGAGEITWTAALAEDTRVLGIVGAWEKTVVLLISKP